jgi:hypothetical protein
MQIRLNPPHYGIDRVWAGFGFRFGVAMLRLLVSSFVAADRYVVEFNLTLDIFFWSQLSVAPR